MNIYITHFDWDVGGRDLYDDGNMWSISVVGVDNLTARNCWYGGTSVIEVRRYRPPDLAAGSQSSPDLATGRKPVNIGLGVWCGIEHVADVLEGQYGEFTRRGCTLYVELSRVMTKL